MTKQTSPLKTLIATASVFAFLAGPLAGSAFAEGPTSGQGSGKGGPQGGGQKGGQGGASAVTGGGSGGKAGGTKISGKDLARLNSARVFLSTGITKTDAIYEDEAPLSKIYNYQQLLLANDKDLNLTAEVAAAAFNLARVSAIPVTADTLTKLDAFLGTTYKSTYNFTTGGAAVETALETTTLSVLGKTVDIATPTSFIDAVNLLQKALKAEEE